MEKYAHKKLGVFCSNDNIANLLQKVDYIFESHQIAPGLHITQHRSHFLAQI